MPRQFPAARHPPAANDNQPGVTARDVGRRALLQEALRHFAAHGAGAADHARGKAEQAFFAGRRRDYLHWLAVCRTLDRRMVDAVPPGR